jgi:stress-induced morphogen
LHAGHAGNPHGGADAETHFRVEVVSDAFNGLPLVARHRLVYAALKTELAQGLHALALKTKTPAEGAP